MFYARDIVIYRGDEVTPDALNKLLDNPPLDREIKAIMQKRHAESEFNILDLFFTGKLKFQYRLTRVKNALISMDGLVPKKE